MQRRLGPHTAESLERIAADLKEDLQRIERAAAILRLIRTDEPIMVMGSRGIFGSETHPGALSQIEGFSIDALKKASLREKEHRRKRR
jgi:ribosomal protein S19E (S16A)